MGIYDREYYREEPRGFNLGGPRMMVTNLVLINVAVYLFHILVFPDPRPVRFGPSPPPGPFTEIFALKANLFSHPWQFYQLLTYGFLHDTNDVWHIIINMAVLWFLGREVEGIYGQKKFLQFYLSTIVLSGLFWLIVENVIGYDGRYIPYALGASGAVMGVMIVFVMHFPRRLLYLYFLIPVPIWLVAAGMVAYDLIRAVGRQGGVASSAHLAGAALGYLFFRTQWQLGRYLPSRLSLRGLSLRPRPRIHRPPDEDDDVALKAEVDRILEKISRSGEASLSSRERQTLEDASRRYQQRGRR